MYHSVPFFPSSSWLYECYGAGLSKEVRVIKGLLTEWGKCLRTVTFDSHPLTLACWDTIIAVGSVSRDIIILDAITGSCTAILSGHVSQVRSVTFSSDGKLLVSGSNDHSVKLWDVQTGGIVKDFAGHKDWVWSVSISADSTIIASGSQDSTIRLWDISTGKCHCVIEQQKWIYQVGFSPTDPKQLIGRLVNDKFSHWDINGCQIGLTYDGSHVAFSLDGKQLAVCNKEAIIVQAFEPRETVAEFHVTNGIPRHCCFSPNGKLLAAAVKNTAYVWDIASLDTHPIETFIGHTDTITALTFYSPSSLISASWDQSVKFWQIGALLTKLVETDLSPISSPSNEVASTTIQAKDGITITSDSNGTVRIWDISTGLCKGLFQTPAINSLHRDVQFINGRLISAWSVRDKIHIHGASEEELILESRSGVYIVSLRIAEDGSRIFCLDKFRIQAWSIMTGEFLGKVEIKHGISAGSLLVDGLRVWVCYPESTYQGWDFGIPGSSPVQLPNIPPSKLNPNGTLLWDWAQSKVQDVVTGRIIFELHKLFRKPTSLQWNNQCLVICFGPNEVLILDFTCVLAL